jgi:drug/metabolite transporter (DMT)-like permease
VFALVYLALLGSSLTFVLLYWLIQRIPVTRTMMIPFMSTLIAVLLGAVVLDEQLTWRVVAGGAGILGGLAIAMVRRRVVELPGADR